MSNAKNINNVITANLTPQLIIEKKRYNNEPHTAVEM